MSLFQNYSDGDDRSNNVDGGDHRQMLCSGVPTMLLIVKRSQNPPDERQGARIAQDRKIALEFVHQLDGLSC